MNIIDRFYIVLFSALEQTQSRIACSLLFCALFSMCKCCRGWGREIGGGGEGFAGRTAGGPGCSAAY